MSEDEILKDIDNYISFANKAENFSDINEYLHCKELARRMKGLLDLYQKEKEKIEAMNKGIDELVREKQDLKTELYMNSVSKDKIRELLKVIQKEKDIATKNILEKDYNLAENGAICQELGYIEGELKKLLED